MSSDPIEVLRELVQRWRKEESRHEEGMNSVDPAVSNYHEGMSQAFGECADELESALASLSAPKPPPMNDNAVAVNESAPVNDKPESAEAVCPRCGAAEVSGAACPRCGNLKPFSDPPRPEASAPVGVEEVVKAMRLLAGVRIPVKPECVGRWADQLEALAQQPAAVDEATRRDAERYRYLRRPEAWKENWITERGASAIFIGDGRRGEAKDGEALDAAIDRILAGQQQGGES